MPSRNIELSAFDDFLSLRVLLFSIISLVLTFLLFMAIFSFLYSSYSGEYDIDFFKSVENITHDIFVFMEAYPLFSFIIEHKIIMLLLHYLIYFGVGLLFYYLFVAFYSFIISFFIIYFISYLQKKYYTDVKLEGIGIVSTTFFYLKSILITIILFVIFSPAYIIPALNLLIFVPIYYFFHKTLVYDVSSVINTKREYKKIKKVNGAELKARTGFCFLLTLIPVFGILLYPYYFLYIGHYLLRETRELRYVEAFNA